MEHIHPVFSKMTTRASKEKFLNQRAKVIWLTGLSGSGKSTIAIGLEKLLLNNGFFSKILDGDNIRTGVNNNLGFSIEERKENIRRIAEVSKLFCENGVICINSFVSPTSEIRALAKSIIGEADFIEVFVNTSLETCEKRDVKGLYKKARAREIKGFTGIDSPFDIPTDPEINLVTENKSIEECVNIIYNYMLPYLINK